MKLLTFSSLFPNAEMPSHGVFVENRLRELVAGGRVEARVVAPVPWFPFASERFGRFARYARVPQRETRFGIEVVHPRYFVVPKVGMSVTPLTMALAARPAVAALIASGYDFDAIDAHYFYPDGVAAALLARWFDRPFVVTARGSDVTELPNYAAPRRMIRWAAREAASIVTVCAALKRDLTALGVEPAKIEVLRNGVDLAAFAPVAQAVARERLGLAPDARVVASVGHLIPRKGHEFAIEALAALPDTTLLVVGSGPERDALGAVASRCGVADRVRFVGQLAHRELPTVYSAVDVLVLASSAEGWANVLLEAMACGTPVVATDVGGSGEVVATHEAGILVPQRDAASIATAVAKLFRDPPARGATRHYAERFGWDETTRGQEALFRAVLAKPRGLQWKNA